jgi:serine/threonine-protein kinase
LDEKQTKALEAALAQHLGPIAAVMVRKAAKSAPSLAALAHGLAGEIADEKARAVFLKKFAENSRPSQPPPVPSAPPTGLTQLAQARFAPELLAKAEKRLADYIGAVAKVVVKRAAAKARDEGELYLLIADEISDPAERKAFIKKAISVSGKPH